MSSRVTSRATARVIAAGAAALALAAGVAPAASAQSLDDPAWPADRPFPPATEGPNKWAELSYWPYAITPSDPHFWAPNSAPMRVLSPFGTDTEIWCSNYVLEGSDCWQRDPSGVPHRLDRVTVLGDVITGSTGSAADGSVRGAYALATERGWPTTSGGVFIPGGTVPGFATGTWVSLMPFAPFRTDSRYLDVWVYPGFVPGS
ncbi:hypothetical protein [Dietzia lutea]|uniref:Secreted protein n=1 Tax=Dietzia lutea TaxID=546160 RepID=A0A2S1R5E1_9ACTN|nr:hypothetical protein [Dietzia lutea]AWH91497.1 hypothetical protein A6035_04165 [Dietzia lutea]